MISQKEFENRRRKLAQQLPKNSIALFSTSHEYIRNGDSHFKFRQDSNFYYLTGFEEPHAVLAISSGKNSPSILFSRPPNPEQEQWTGKRLGQEGAIEVLGMDMAFPIHSLKEELPKLFMGLDAIYYLLGQDKELEQLIISSLKTLKGHVRKGLQAPSSLHDIEPILSDMRLFKSADEIDLMRRAAIISVEAHKRAMRQCKHLQQEYQVEAELLYEFRRHGCDGLAYDSIVACGENACVLHYTANNQPLQAEKLLLIDAGGEYQGYAADITRTFPINGKYSSEQKSIYELVLAAQKAGIAKVKPGNPWNGIQETIIKTLVSGLCDLGILKGSVDSLIEQEAYKPLYMHNSGHWLGLDVHDSGHYKIKNTWRSLEKNMVLTVEPGLYISSHLTQIDKRWHGIGIRIEDDILVTANGHEILTSALPSGVDDIEDLMRE